MRPADARRGHVRHDGAAAAQPDRPPGARPGARQPLQRQRRPADVLLRTRRRTTESGQTRFIDPDVRPGHHDRDPQARRRRRGGRRAAATTCRRRASPSSPTGSSRRRRSRHPLIAPRASCGRSSTYRLNNRNESTISAEVAEARRPGPAHRRARCRCSAWAATRPTGASRLTRRRTRRRVDDRDEQGVLRRDARARCGTSPRRSAAASATTRCGGRKRVVTVHPLGGAPMGRHVHEGVVDSWGESFGHPGPVRRRRFRRFRGRSGPNPSLTIAAIADRAVEHLLEKPRPKRAPAHARGSRRVVEPRRSIPSRAGAWSSPSR